MKLTANFSKSEFNCNCGCVMPVNVLENVKNLANQLQVLRNYVGQSIKINSGYRCEKWNANPRVGGTKTSQHILGKAADVVVTGLRPDDVAHLLEQLNNSGDIKIGGLGRYNNFTHVDIRDNKARWNFKSKD